MKARIKGICEIIRMHARNIFDEEHVFVFSGSEIYEKGVGVDLDKNTTKSLLSYCSVSDSILNARLTE